jgi:hypothetical protein
MLLRVSRRNRVKHAAGSRIGAMRFAVFLTALAAFEIRNHETGVAPFLVGAAIPELPVGRKPLHSASGPLALGIAGFWVPRGSRLQVAALGWAAHIYAHRALGYDARD